jgi:hypothetical protein
VTIVIVCREERDYMPNERKLLSPQKQRVEEVQVLFDVISECCKAPLSLMTK